MDWKWQIARIIFPERCRLTGSSFPHMKGKLIYVKALPPQIEIVRGPTGDAGPSMGYVSNLESFLSTGDGLLRFQHDFIELLPYGRTTDPEIVPFDVWEQEEYGGILIDEEEGS